MKLKKIMATVAIASVLGNVAGCGVLLHPERQGQQGGKIDVEVALLNSIGLVFFVVPGLVAFAIDFHQGTIYLPGGITSASSDDGLRVVKLKGKVNKESIEAAVREELGVNINLSADNVQAQQVTPEQLGMISTIALYNGDRTVVPM